MYEAGLRIDTALLFPAELGGKECVRSPLGLFNQVIWSS